MKTVVPVGRAVRAVNGSRKPLILADQAVCHLGQGPRERPTRIQPFHLTFLP